MVNICDMKRHLILYILPYFHDIYTYNDTCHFWWKSYNEMRVSA